VVVWCRGTTIAGLVHHHVANSSDVDVVAGREPGGGWISVAVPIENAESPIAAPAIAATDTGIDSVIPLLACAIPIPIAAQFDSPRLDAHRVSRIQQHD